MSAAIVLLGSVGCSRVLPESPSNGEEASAAAPLGAFRPGMDLRQTFDSLSPTAHTARIGLLDDNAAAWTARWRMVSEARERIDIDYFIFSQDVFGLALMGLLLEKARAGVDVRVLLDAQGLTMSVQPHDLDCWGALAEEEHVAVRIHRSLSRRVVEALVELEPTLATASDHDKIIVADRRVSLVGGRNIEAKYFAHPDDLQHAFYDVDVILEAESAGAALTDVFESTFGSDRVTRLGGTTGDRDRCVAAMRLAAETMDAYLHGRPLDPTTQREIGAKDLAWIEEVSRFLHLKGAGKRARSGEPIKAAVHVIDSLPRPGSASDAVTQSLMRLFNAASDTILMESPYLVLTDHAAGVLEETGRRGVEMTVLTNSAESTDNTLSQMYFQEQWPRLLAATPNLRLYVSGTRRNVHSKYVVFDEQAVLIGSYNIDPFSMLVSGEIMIAVWSRPFAQEVGARPRAMIAGGAPLVYEYRIAREPDGDPIRTADGSPVIAFGPDHHTDPIPTTGVRWVLLRGIPFVSGLPPFF